MFFVVFFVRNDAEIMLRVLAVVVVVVVVNKTMMCCQDENCPRRIPSDLNVMVHDDHCVPKFDVHDDAFDFFSTSACRGKLHCELRGHCERSRDHDASKKAQSGFC